MPRGSFGSRGGAPGVPSGGGGALRPCSRASRARMRLALYRRLRLAGILSMSNTLRPVDPNVKRKIAPCE